MLLLLLLLLLLAAIGAATHLINGHAALSSGERVSKAPSPYDTKGQCSDQPSEYETKPIDSSQSGSGTGLSAAPGRLGANAAASAGRNPALANK
jgi:hypothetical protein